MTEEFWAAIVSCDSRYDGRFYYGLRTTGVFCKPSCKSKTPKRENVGIYATPDEARKAGLRPCKRCRPEESGWRSHEEELAMRVVDLISRHFHQPLSLQEIAARLFVSPFYLQRCFQRVMRKSPSRFLLEMRLKEAKRLLQNTPDSITDIAWRVGFQSSSHFSAVFRREIGVSPSGYRQAMKAPHQQGVIPS
jgi:AraC family transcriptional regulator of adaptative response / methylphosphotriester-DNA alkyltransferase methyltransferase